MAELRAWFGQDGWFLSRDIRERQLEEVAAVPRHARRRMARDWQDFVAGACPSEFKMPMFLGQGRDTPLALYPRYLAYVKEKYGDLSAVNRAYLDNAARWTELSMPEDLLHRAPDRDPRGRDWREFVESRPPLETGLINLDALLHQFLITEYGTAARLAEKTDLDIGSLTKVTFDDLMDGHLGDRAGRKFFRMRAPLRFVEVDVDRAQDAWDAFLADRGEPARARLPARIPETPIEVARWARFIQHQAPLEALDVARPDPIWWELLRERYGTVECLNAAYHGAYGHFEDVTISRMFAATQYETFYERRARIRWDYLIYNFATVIRFVAIHGRALWVTLILIVLTIGTALTVNPLAAYAMSRFRLPESHALLVLLLATMAFPSEVLMIPGFLLIKSFPLVQILLVAACIAILIGLKVWLGRRLPLVPAATGALVLTGFLVGYVVPRLAARYDVDLSISLMNSFWALILPSLANGYGIFLLKGFFDSLPPELYEAGLMDGASELRMFRQITLPLCKPIMAAMALGAFTAAYGAFMHAFLVCQDPNMWTLMVFLYEFQQTHALPLVMASLVVAAVPTLLVFIFCQNIILRGIVIPTFK